MDNVLEHCNLYSMFYTDSSWGMGGFLPHCLQFCPPPLSQSVGRGSILSQVLSGKSETGNFWSSLPRTSWVNYSTYFVVTGYFFLVSFLFDVLTVCKFVELHSTKIKIKIKFAAIFRKKLRQKFPNAQSYFSLINSLLVITVVTRSVT